MSKDETGSTESQGIPGFSANNTIPGGFALPIPVAGAGATEPEAAPADPWSSTWDDTSWQSGEVSDDTAAYDTSELGRLNGYSQNGGSLGSDDAEDAGPASTSGSTNTWTDWEPSDPGTADWSASATEEPEQTSSGWTPAGSASDAYDSGAASTSAAPGTTDHTAAQRAYAARPAVDPDVAAMAAERGYDPAEYDLTPAARAGNSDRPSAEDLITARSKGERQKTKANSGLRKAFGMGPSVKEMLERDRIDRIARPLGGRKTIMVINTKGGGGKTLVTLMLASYLGRYRSGSVLAWDNNETEGTLGMRAPSQSHHRTVVDLLGALPTIAEDPNAGTSELEHWVREQRGLSFDVLASADDDEAMRIIGEQEFEDLHTQLSRFYRMIVVDTGNNRLSPNWLAAAARADMLVFATSLKDDTSVVAAKNLDALVAMGRGDLVRNAVCVISHTSAKGNDVGAGVHTREHFEQWVRAVVDIPYDPMLAPGLHLDPLKISRKTHESCMEMAAVVVDGL
ncbi:hypothetical protein GCM10009721_09330 [Terrabacter tumescens]|uniref:MinD-like ATPase involved in chromosome partitioning or flagellar assembly n=1 Tax=Terrabacter tumescens TaxID=60443 RepID=A0ABQ2HR20_9MICO|nr:hypothetical protein [Terrabacter tumescens]GGM86676.1 hypothetical protein GCM10009721_09330 [Terrabacter tumescens]